MLAQPVAKRAKHGVIKARVIQSKAEQIFPVDPGPHRLGRLAITQSFSELEQGDQGQPPGRVRWLTASGVEIGKVRIIKHSPKPLTQQQVWITPPECSVGDTGGIFRHWRERGLRMERHG